MNLAQQAIQQYDQNGEQAMLHFLSQNLEERDSLPDGSDPGLIILKDHTAVQNGQHSYSFLWTEDNYGYRFSRVTHRRAHLGPNECPQPRQRSIPLLPWPNQDTVWEAAIREIEGQACEQMGLQQDLEDPPLISIAQAARIAPSLHQHIQDVMDNLHLSDSFMQELDSHQTTSGEQLVRQLPQDEFNLLLHEATAILRQNPQASA